MQIIARENFIEEGFLIFVLIRFTVFLLGLLIYHRTGANVIKPNVTFQIRSTTGAILGSISTGILSEENGEVWKNFYLDFRSDPSSSEVDVVLINNAPGGNGNDLAIDDISFSPCGPSTSITATLGNLFTTGVCDNSQSFILMEKFKTTEEKTLKWVVMRKQHKEIYLKLP